MSEEAKSKRTRSPAYPAIDLEEAIAKAATLWEKNKRHAAVLETASEQWGYDKNSSTGVSVAAALLKYGLVSDEGSGDNRSVKLTEDAIRLTYNPDTNSTEYQQALKKAALMPKIHAELWKKYDGEVPDDGVVKRYLVVDRRFNEQYVDGFIKQFKKTIKFANIKNGDTVALPQDDDVKEMEKPLFQQKNVMENFGAATDFNKLFPGTQAPPTMREFNFPLPAGVATLKLPFPLTEEDFESLVNTLEMFKDGLVKKPDPVSVECAEGWENRVNALAGLGVEINLTNFDYCFEIEKAKKIAIDNNFDLRLDLNKGMALFRKRADKTKKA